jgi:hypothetical protein
MPRLTCLLAGLLLAAGALAATPEQAAELFAAKDWPGAAAAYRDIVAREPANAFAWFRLARAQAQAGHADEALASLQAWIATGNGSYQAAMAVPELQPLHADPRFAALVDPLKPCTAPEYRQFDFWLGDWDVESPAAPGSISHNRISGINGGCTLREEYTTATGYEGTSLNFYDAARRSWHQTWIDNQGGALYLEGGLRDGSMVLATTGDPKNLQRITWTPLDDGRVRQHWEASVDGGGSWTTVFDGFYTRR